MGAHIGEHTVSMRRNMLDRHIRRNDAALINFDGRLVPGIALKRLRNGGIPDINIFVDRIDDS
ncbi:hypothetical protein D3C87_2067380 [compost metagenome]